MFRVRLHIVAFGVSESVCSRTLRLRLFLFVLTYACLLSTRFSAAIIPLVLRVRLQIVAFGVSESVCNRKLRLRLFLFVYIT